jgi:hypothetical protein
MRVLSRLSGDLQNGHKLPQITFTKIPPGRELEVNEKGRTSNVLERPAW